MSMSRKGSLVLSCCGVALVVAATGVVLVGLPERTTASGGPEAGRGHPREVPAAQTMGLAPAPVDVAVEPMPGVPVLGKGETFYGRGEVFFRDRDYASASRYLRAEVDLHPDWPHPLYLLGLSLWKEGRLEDSIEALSRAASLDASAVKARINLGRVLNDASRFGEALAAAEQAIVLNPDDSSAHNVRGRALLNLARRREAIEAFRTAAEKDPGNAYALNNLGYALIGAGDFGEAVPILEKAVEINSEIGYFHNNLGMAYERTGQPDKAREAYSAAVQAGGSEAAERNLERIGVRRDDESPRLLDESAGLY